MTKLKEIINIFRGQTVRKNITKEKGWNGCHKIISTKLGITSAKLA